jgi:hypothetical protein
MRELTLDELNCVTGAGDSLLTSAGLNTSGAFTGIDSGNYALPPQSYGPRAPTEGVQSINFFTPVGAAIQFGILFAQSMWQQYA